jgi:hypothetical protein
MVKYHDPLRRPKTEIVDAQTVKSSGSLLKFYSNAGYLTEAFSIGDIIEYSQQPVLKKEGGK